MSAWRKLMLALSQLVLWTGVLAAQAPPGAAQLFDEARVLLERRDYAAACAKLEQSRALDPQLGTQLHLAHCLEKQGQLPAAYRAFQRAARMAAERNQPPGSEPREQLARSRAASLEPRLSLLELQLPDMPGLRLELDGAALEPADCAVPLALEPGEHRLRASASGHVAWDHAFSLGAPARLGIRVPELGAAPPPLVAAAAPPLPPPTRTEPTPVPEPGPSVQRIAGYATLGAGIVGIGLGVALGLMRNAKVDALGDYCDLDSGRCPLSHGDDAGRARIESLHGAASNLATAANLAWIAGGAAVLGGVVLILTTPRRDAPALTLGVSPAGVSLMVRHAL